jgi:creatinine amidohydrolase
MTGSRHRVYAECSFPQIGREMTGEAILCLPVGSTEQHGPHLPLATDTIIAERFAAALADRAAGRHELWLLPAMPFGLSLEHAWAPGTVSLRVATFTALIRQLASEYARATPARRLVIVNGHGGNRGILEPLMLELSADYGVAACALHPLSLATPRPGGDVADVHAGIGETSLMLHLAPSLVSIEALAGISDGGAQQRAPEVDRVVRDRGATWPWSSGDAAIAESGVIGDPRGASAGLGRAILASALEPAVEAITRLAEAPCGGPRTREKA